MGDQSGHYFSKDPRGRGKAEGEGSILIVTALTVKAKKLAERGVDRDMEVSLRQINRGKEVPGPKSI